MTQKEYFQDKSYLREQQYKDSSNLDARANIHRLYSTKPARLAGVGVCTNGVAARHDGAGMWLWAGLVDA